MNKKMIYASLFLFIVVIFSNSIAKEFQDVAIDHWAHEYINYLSDNSIINGYEDNTFKPNDNISRAEFIKLITSANKSNEYFEYEKNHTITYNWYDVYMNYALTNGFLTKEIGFGNPNDLLTRKEMVIILGKIAKTHDFVNSKDVEKANFTDIQNVFSKDESIYLDYACSSELISGYEDGTFKPLNNMTRAEVATVIFKFVNKVEN